MTDILEQLRDQSVQLARRSFDSVDAGLAANVADAAIDEIERLRSALAQRALTQSILQNQIEIMGALSLLLRYAAPNLIGKAGELDSQRDDLLQRHKATQRALAALTSTER